MKRGSENMQQIYRRTQKAKFNIKQKYFKF